MKKILSVILAAAVAICCICVSAFAATMTLSNETYPTELVKGKTFSAYGIISSDYDILRVEISVKDSAGKSAISYIGNPGTKTYNIHNVDYLLEFSKLELGTYTYKITATDTKSSNVVLLSKQFKVVSTATPTTLKISDATYPTSFVQGNTFSVYGTVTSDYTITSVTCAVYSEGGALQFTKTATPNDDYYSVHNIDSYMTFSKLSAGSYVYKITASDTKTKNVELLSKSFTVTSSAVSSSLKLNNETHPVALIAGETFSVRGTITSDYTITSVTVGVYTASGTSKFKYSGSPNSKSFDIHSIDSQMTFSKLGEGSYVYKITASDTKSKDVVLLQQTFTVGKVSSAEDGLKKVNWDVIDLSYWNEIESWDKIANSVDGVILRIGYRATVSHKIGGDSTFLEFYKAAKAKGLPVGCYFFSAALTKTEAVEEAEYVMKVIKENNIKLDMPVYFDMETEDQVDLSQSACTEVARAFCDKMKANGYYVGVYCNKYFARDELYASQLSDVTMWIAQYGSKCTYEGAYGMWQYSETGHVTGLYEYVDMNYCYYDFPSYIKANGYNGFTSPVPVTPTYSFNSKDGIKTDTANKYVLNVAPGISTSKFLNTYITRSSNVSVTFSNSVSGNVATGTTITFKNDGKTLATYTVSVAGDVDGNGVANSADALGVLECAIGKKILTGVKKCSADMDSNGTINSADALKILQSSVGIG